MLADSSRKYVDPQFTSALHKPSYDLALTWPKTKGKLAKSAAADSCDVSWNAP